MIAAAVFDYGAGNIYSIVNGMQRVAPYLNVRVTNDAASLTDAKLIVLPGVGSFPHAAERLAPARDKLRGAIADGAFVYGVCLGLQLLFDRSEEGAGEGLGVLPGRVTTLKAPMVPHMGWNSIEPTDVTTGSLVLPSTAYFAHGFVCCPDDDENTLATTTVGESTFPSVVRRGRVMGAQFHPEKSAEPGLAFMSSFLAEVAA